MHSPQRPSAVRRRRTLGVLAFTLSGVLALAACGGSSSKGTATSGSSSASSSSGSSSDTTSSSAAPGSSASGSTPSSGADGGGVATAQAQVDKYSKLITSFTPPGPAIKGIKAKMTGKVIWYVPIFLQAPYFSAAAKDLSAVMARVGATVHICDAGANPSQAASCLKQAINAKPAAIVTDAIDAKFASSAYKSIIAAGIPVVATNNDTAQGFDKTPLLTTVSAGGVVYARLAVDWMISDSGGKAEVLYAADRSPNGDVETVAAKDEFAKLCPKCVVHYVEFSDLSINQLPTAISSGLNAHPKVKYVFGAYDAPSGIFAAQGVKQVVGRKVKFLTSGAQPPALQRMAAGQQDAVPGFDPVGTMYNTADAVFRIVLKDPTANYTPFVRLFTKANMPSDAKTGAGYGTGEWFSDGSFKAAYQKLWGV